eukprot:2521407-Amphidinium_carterae.1
MPLTKQATCERLSLTTFPLHAHSMCYEILSNMKSCSKDDPMHPLTCSLTSGDEFCLLDALLPHAPPTHPLMSTFSEARCVSRASLLAVMKSQPGLAHPNHHENGGEQRDGICANFVESFGSMAPPHPCWPVEPNLQDPTRCDRKH